MIVPSPLGMVCWCRSLWRSIRVGTLVDGCDYLEAEPEEGQPAGVSVLHCTTCGKLAVGWNACARCGHRPGAKLELGKATSSE